MKKAIYTVLIVVLTTTTLQAQEFFFSASQDIKMAFQGAHGEGGMLNGELKFGVQINRNERVWMGYEWLHQIEYEKHTVIAYDYTIPLLDRLNIKCGAEVSVIHRPTPYESDQAWSYGLNGEIAYKVLDSVELFLSGNIFKAEPADNFGNEMKMWRADVMFGITITLCKVP